MLKAVGWVESNWRQFTPAGRPLVSFDFGYGIMQITSGMAGAFGDPSGSIDPSTQSKIASDPRINIGFGMRMLIDKYLKVPKIGDGDTTEVENWYYALWAYNGWGFVNNPNNPRFTRQGTPATNPTTYPYQERVLYLVAHPPRDAAGNPLWQPVPVWMPPRTLIGSNPGRYTPARTHRQPVRAFAATFSPSRLQPLRPAGTELVNVRVQNTGTQAWAATGTSAISLTYHLFTPGGNPWRTFSPFSPGVIALGQASVPLPHTVLPGRTVSLAVSVRAPTTTGQYLVVWDLQELPATWLSQVGVLPRAERLAVQTGGTPSPSATPAPTPTAEPPNGALFVVDTAFPDGSAVRPRVVFRKGWLVYNSGSRAWSRSWALRHISGPTFGVRTAPLPAVGPCRAVNLSVSMKAPSTAGSYRGVWRFQDPSRRPFGDKLTVVLSVQGRPPTGTPVAFPTPTPNPIRPHPTATPRATATPTPVG